GRVADDVIDLVALRERVHEHELGRRDDARGAELGHPRRRLVDEHGVRFELRGRIERDERVARAKAEHADEVARRLRVERDVSARERRDRNARHFLRSASNVHSPSTGVPSSSKSAYAARTSSVCGTRMPDKKSRPFGKTWRLISAAGGMRDRASMFATTTGDTSFTSAMSVVLASTRAARPFRSAFSFVTSIESAS